MPSSLHIDSHPEWGGGQVQSLGLALALASRGEEVWFLTQTGSDLAARLRGSYLKWAEAPLRGLAGITCAPQLARRLGELRPDIVHIHDSASHATVGLAARIAARRAGGGADRPRIIVTRRTEFPLRHGWLGRAKYGLACDRVICVSEAIRRRCLEGRIPEQMLRVIPDFVDCRHFDPEAAAVPENAHSQTIVAVGRLARSKGHRVLLQAMAQVVRTSPEARLVVCGSGSEEPALRALAQALGIADKVSFTGFVSDVRSVLAQADVFAMPSLSEGLGVSVLEAMAMARPVVATDAGGLSEAVVHSETGLVVPRGDVAALADALLRLLEDPGKAQQMGRAGRQRALDCFERRRVVERVLDLYNEVLSENR